MDYFNSPNNIRLGEDEIYLLMDYLKVNRNELVDRIEKNLVSFYFHINTVSYKLIVNEPPHIYYEIYLLFKIDETYYRQIFSKKKFPLEFKDLNEFEFYRPLTPLDQSISFNLIEYPLYDICYKKSVFSIKEKKEIKKIISNKIPFDVTNLILEYLVVSTYDKDENNFCVTNDIINQGIIIDRFLPVSNEKVVISLKV